MDRPTFDREMLGDTSPSTEVDYDLYRHRAVMERRAAIAAFPAHVLIALGYAWSALSRLRHRFMRMRPYAARHQDLWPEDSGNHRRRA